jgi:carbon starvation protein CstA
MITFIVCLVVLVLGYVLYGALTEKIFGMDPERATPAVANPDGVDSVPMGWMRIFLIQFLNIAGLGPIFGAVAGAMWGPVAFIWIVLGCIFAGAVHDYFSGMLSIRNGGASIAEVVGIYLGPFFKHFTRLFSVVLLVLVGVVFVSGPARILSKIPGEIPPEILNKIPSEILGGFEIAFSFQVCVYVIFAYYLLATLLPIDKLIGRIYPFFGLALLVMAAGICYGLIAGGHAIPEISLQNMHLNPEKYPIFPMLFITIACGAISGFHATQSPLMARCVTSERLGRRIFYGAMIAEGIVAMIWAAAAMTFFGGVSALNATMGAADHNPAWAVTEISMGFLGGIGGILAILGVVAAPITSGDTAFRSARLIIADALRLKQGPILRRLVVTIPLFVIGFLLTRIDFGIIWRYFAWSNQTLATLMLWTAAMYLARKRGFHWLLSVPATVMTAVCATYILFASEGFALAYGLSVGIGVATALAALAAFLYAAQRSARGAARHVC